MVVANLRSPPMAMPDANVRRSMLNELPRYIAMFAMYDPNYVVTIGDGKASVREGDASESESVDL